MTVHKWIAEQDFRCVRPSGEVLALTVRIGQPVPVDAGDAGHGYARCRIAMEPTGQGPLGRWSKRLSSPLPVAGLRSDRL
jgi:hypothetical protein